MPIANELTLNTSASAMDMANAMFGNGITIQSATYTGAADASGTFTGGLSTLGSLTQSDTGVILSTGNAADFTNSSGTTDTNTAAGTSTDHTGAGEVDGDTDLDAVSGQATQDGAFFDATFIAQGDLLTMQFVFTSEEYLEYVNGGVNDAMGIWVNGTYVPLTLADGSSQNVTIDTINNNVTSNLYLDNPATSDIYNTEMDGGTVVLSIVAPVNAGQSNTIRIGIGDGGDSAYDSNLLIMGNSIQTISIAESDQLEQLPNATETHDILANDINIDNNTLTITHINNVAVNVGDTVTLPSGEQITLNADMTVTVLTDSDIGTNQFTYSTVDSAGNASTGLATIETTLTPQNYIWDGTSGDDTIEVGYVDADGDVIDNSDYYDGSNRDSVEAGAGNDTVISGDGADTVRGEDGDDLIWGDSYNAFDAGDLLDGGAGHDSIYGAGGDDTVLGGDGNDTLYGETGDDSLVGGGWDDSMLGGTGEDTLRGDDGFDYLDGGAGNDSLFGGGDNDVIVGGTGEDTIAGDDGFDSITGNDGNDVIDGGLGDDTILGGNGNDTVLGGDGDDSIQGNAGADSLVGNAGADTIWGGSGDDTLEGGADADVLNGGAGADSILGGSGDDTITLASGDDTVNAGDDADTIVVVAGGYADGATVTVDGATTGNDFDTLNLTSWDAYRNLTQTTDGDGDSASGSVEVQDASGNWITVNFTEIEVLNLPAVNMSPNYIVEGTGGDDTIDAAYLGDPQGDQIDNLDHSDGSNDDSVQAGAGNDSVLAGLGNDTVDGGAGSDTIRGGAGNDSMDGGLGEDELLGGTGDDTLFGNAGNDSLGGDDGNDVLDAGDGRDIVYGDAGNDSILGGAGNDTLYGLTDDDTIDGGTGDDTIEGGTGDDSLLGDLGNDSIGGSTGNDTARGGFGNDTISGGSGNDEIYGNEDDDSLTGGMGDDSIYGETGNDYVSGGTGSDSLEGNEGDDTILGGAGDDWVRGSFGNDEIHGGEGDDYLWGGYGDDTIHFADNFGDDTVEGEEANETDGDTIDLSAITSDLTIDLTSANPEAGTFTDGTDTVSFVEIENIVLGGGADTLVLGTGGGADRVEGFTIPTESGGVYTGVDLLDVSTLLDINGAPVNTDDVTISTDANGDAVLSFPSGESLTLVGVTAASINSPDILEAMGIPQPNYIVEGTGAAELIDGTYIGDPEGDIIDGNDNAAGTNADSVQAGAGDDTVLSYVGNDTIDAGAGNDSIDAGDGDDFVIGGDGNDTIQGWFGDDSVEAGAGDDSVEGFLGNDTLLAGAGEDTVLGGDGNDSIRGNAGNDSVEGGAGDDTVEGGLGNDTILGDDGNDSILGQQGDDSIVAGLGADTVIAGDGDDHVDAGFGDDSVEGGLGNDTLIGGFGDDLLDDEFGLGTNGGGDDSMDAGFGNDTVYAGVGDDTLLGGDGNDLLSGEEGADLIDGGADSDTILVWGAVEADTIDGGEAVTFGVDFDVIDASTSGVGLNVAYTGDEAGTLSDGSGTATFSNIEGLTLTGQGDSVDASATSTGVTLNTGAGADTVTGGSGDDTVDLGAADGAVDTYGMQDGGGDDTVTGFEAPTDNGDGTFSGQDQLDVSGLTGAGGQPVNVYDVTVTDTNGDGTGDAILTFPNGESITLVGVSPSEVSTPAQLNALGIPGAVDGTDAGEVMNPGYTDAQGDQIDGTDGDDDTIFGNGGDDSIRAGAGDDLVYGGADDDTVEGNDGNDTLYGEDGDDSLFGWAGSDSLIGGTGDDTLNGGAGNDTLEGGDDSDVFQYQTGGGADSIIGGEGGTDFDTLATDFVSSDVTVTFDGDEQGDLVVDGVTSEFSEIEQIRTGGGDDSVNASVSGVGVSVLTGFGDDTVRGGTGDDTIDGGAGNDNLGGGAGDDSLTGGAGNDTLATGPGEDTLQGGDDRDTFAYEGGTGTIEGGEGGDDFDTIDAQFLADAINVTFDGSESGSFTSGGNTIDFSEIEGLALGEGNDTVNGALNTSDVLVSGYGGDDILTGGSGDDTLDGGDDDDTLFGGLGSDSLIGGGGADSITLGENDTAEGGSGDDIFEIIDDGTPGGGTINIFGGEGGETLGDTLNFNGLIGFGDVTLTNSDPGVGGGLTGFATLGDGTVVNFTEIENIIICFTEGTRIATPRGVREIEDLEVGDLVVTRDHGLQPVRWVGKRTVPARGALVPIRFDAHVIGNDRPLYVSPQHRMLLQGYEASMLFGESEVLATAKHLVNGSTVTEVHGGEVTYVHILFDQHEIIYAEGAASESFFPGDMGLDAVESEAREELFTIFPELRSHEGAYGDTARLCLKAHESRLLRLG